MTETNNFDDALENFRAVAEQVQRDHFTRNDYKYATPVVETSNPGRRFVRLIQSELWPNEKAVRQSALAFVEITTGDIFKPEGWKRPAKHPRGNIYINEGRDSLSESGSVRYL